MSNKRWGRTLALALPLFPACLLAGCGASTNATSTTATTSGGISTSGTDSAYCKMWKQGNAEAVQQNADLNKSLQSGKLADVKEGYAQFFATNSDSLKAIEPTLESAPANVQAALKTEIANLSQLRTKIQTSTSASQAESVITQWASDPQAKNAATILDQYTTGRCGVQKAG